MTFQKGTLWSSLVRTTERALASGSLVPIPTNHAFLRDGGIGFFVRILSTLSRKDEAKKKQAAESRSGKPANPFLPPEQDLVVADLSDTHVALLNKFNVVEHHLLIITRHFEEQATLLTLRDFEALWRCMAEYDSLGFYNGGREAGASQDHKHLQLVPLPLAPEGPSAPIEPLLPQARAGVVCTASGFPFRHAFVRLPPGLASTPVEAAQQAFDLYRALLAAAGLNAPSAAAPVRQSMPYCFLATRNWMLLVPRSKEFFEDISLNSLAFAGSLFVRNTQQLDRLKSTGPFHALASTALPAKPV